MAFDTTDTHSRKQLTQARAEETRARILQAARNVFAEHARITFAKTIRGGERLEWMVREFVKNNHRSVLPIFEQLVEQGLVPPMPPASFLYALVGMTQLPFVLAKEVALTLDYDMMSEQAIERHADAVIALILPHGNPARASKSGKS